MKRFTLKNIAFGIGCIIPLFFLAACGADLRYSVTGDVSGAIESEDESLEISLETRQFNPETETRETVVLAKEQIGDGIVNIVGEIDEPTVVNVSLLRDEQRFDSIQIVLEPGSEISLSWIGKYSGMVAEGSGKHAEFVASWMMDEHYLALLSDYSVEMQKFMEEREREESSEAEETDATASEQSEEVESESTDAESSSETDAVEEIASSESADEGEMVCSGHISSVPVRAERPEPENMPDRFRLYREIMDFKSDALSQIAREKTEPLDVLLAMELGGLGATQEAVSKYEELAEQLDTETVAHRITPRIESLEAHLERISVDNSLVAGQTVPDFTVPTIEGAGLSLASILDENEIVLLDFWASWCGPCIETFPHLKELYAEYGDDGFEIAALSIDEVRADWEEAVEEHETPWINLGDYALAETDEDYKPVADAYGVTFIPKGFLLDADGCILEKDLTTELLERFLASEFDSEAT